MTLSHFRNKIVKIFFLFFICFAGEAAFAFDHSHSKWSRVLAENVVVNGRQSFVSYEKIQKSPFFLNSYIEEIESVKKTDYDSWSENRKISFLINGYNALTIKLILTKYPVSSIKDLGGFFSSAWKKKFFTLFGESSHLDRIEHDLLRKYFNEPRIHFALVCASKGCPPLAKEAFTGEKLDAQLEFAKQNFLKDRSRNYYDKKAQTLYLSSIFKWFKKDFIRSSGSVEAFVADYISDDPAQQEKIHSRKVNVEYLDYDWSLNKTP